MKRAYPVVLLAIVTGVLAISAAPTQVQPAATPNYADRFEVSDVMIPMRDGAQQRHRSAHDCHR